MERLKMILAIASLFLLTLTASNNSQPKNNLASLLLSETENQSDQETTDNSTNDNNESEFKNEEDHNSERLDEFKDESFDKPFLEPETPFTPNAAKEFNHDLTEVDNNQFKENLEVNIKEIRRAIGRATSECNRGTGSCSENAKKKLKTLKEFIKTLEDYAKEGDSNGFWEKHEEYWQLEQEFWEAHSQSQQARHLTRFLKDLSREIKDRTHWVKDLQRSGLNTSKLESILNKMTDTSEKAETAITNGDAETAQQLLETDFNNLRMEFDETAQGVEQEREKEFIAKDLNYIENEIKAAQAKLSSLDSEKATACGNHLEKGLNIVTKVRTAISTAQFDKADELHYELQEIGHEARFHCGNLLEVGPNTDDFNEIYVDDNNHGRANEVFDRMNEDLATKVLLKLKNNPALFNQLLENAGSHSDKIAQILANTSFVEDQDLQEELLSRKATLLEQIKKMEAKLAHLEGRLGQIKEVRERLLGYNFAGEAGSEIEEELEQFLSESEGLSEEEIATKVAELKAKAEEKINEAREYKYQNGAIAFLDTDDDQWFAPDALFAKQKGFVKGTGESGGKEVNPAADTNLSEALTMIGRLLGEGSTGELSQTWQNRLPEWAHPGAAGLEKAGVNLEEIFRGKSGSDTVDRAEIARLITKAFKFTESQSGAEFNDANQASSEELGALGAVKDAGIMTGSGDGSEFKPQAPLKRAELMKVLRKASEVSGK